MRSWAETRRTHLAPPRRFANVGGEITRIANRRESERTRKGEGSRRYISYCRRQKVRDEEVETKKWRRRWILFPPRRRKAWFVPLLCLCLPFLTRMFVRPPLAWQSARVRFYACVCMYVSYCYTQTYLYIWMRMYICIHRVYVEKTGITDFVVRNIQQVHTKICPFSRIYILFKFEREINNLKTFLLKKKMWELYFNFINICWRYFFMCVLFI